MAGTFERLELFDKMVKLASWAGGASLDFPRKQLNALPMKYEESKNQRMTPIEGLCQLLQRSDVAQSEMRL